MEQAIAQGIAWVIDQGPGFVVAGLFLYLYIQERIALRASMEARIAETKATAQVLFEAVSTLGRATETFLHGRGRE